MILYNSIKLDCTMTLLEYVYQSSITNFHNSMNITFSVLYMFPIMLALCLKLSMTHYAKTYAGIIGRFLVVSYHSRASVMLQ